MPATAITFHGGVIEVQATIVAEALEVEASLVMSLVRSGQITSLCERGLGADEGRYRLTFFHESKRLRLVVDESGRILRRSTLNFGHHPLPPHLHRPGP
jgi:Family of unknown function (DUF6522)